MPYKRRVMMKDEIENLHTVDEDFDMKKRLIKLEDLGIYLTESLRELEERVIVLEKSIR